MGTKRKNHKWTEKEEKEIVEWYNGWCMDSPHPFSVVK